MIGMDDTIPLKRFLTGLGGHHDVPDKCKAIFQMLVFELDEEGRCRSAEKIKIYDDNPKVVAKAWIE